MPSKLVSPPSGGALAAIEGTALFPDGARIVAGKRQHRAVPKELQQRLTRVGGRNIYDEPNLRLVWGWSRLEWVYNKRARSYERKLRYFVKPSRWYVEKWFPAGYYGTPNMWRRQWTENVDGVEVDLLGPYPSRGGYECVAMVERRHSSWCKNDSADICQCGGGYVELTPDVCDELVRRLERGRDVNVWDRRAAVVSKIENDWTKDDAVIDQIVDDVMPAFGSRAHAVVPAKWKGASL